MPTHVLAQIGWQYDSALPRDRVVNTPCFRWDNLTEQDAASLAGNVIDGYVAAFPGLSPIETHCKIYDLEGTQPVLPMADVVRNPGAPGTSTRPRETAICLSFAGGQKQPRQRGRVYLPAGFVGTTAGLRPTSGQMASALGLADALHGVGGANVDWIVWSRINRSATGVNYAWVDDEWDTVRSRGLRSTTRQSKSY